MKIKDIEVNGHFIMLCKICNKVIAQCRCMDCNKKKIYSICDDCEKAVTDGEKLLVEHFRGMNGSFYQSFFNTALKADETNLTRLETGFPSEIQAVRRYKTEKGYWEKLQQKYE